MELEKIVLRGEDGITLYTRQKEVEPLSIDRLMSSDVRKIASELPRDKLQCAARTIIGDSHIELFCCQCIISASCRDTEVPNDKTCQECKEKCFGVKSVALLRERKGTKELILMYC